MESSFLSRVQALDQHFPRTTGKVIRFMSLKGSLKADSNLQHGLFQLSRLSEVMLILLARREAELRSPSFNRCSRLVSNVFQKFFLMLI